MSDPDDQPSKAQSKRLSSKARAEITDSTARAIINAEAESRDAKTRRLRKARLQREAEERSQEDNATTSPRKLKP